VLLEAANLRTSNLSTIRTGRGALSTSFTTLVTRRAELSWYWRQNVERVADSAGTGACTVERIQDNMPAAAIVWMTADAGCGLSKYAAGGVVVVVTGRWALQATA
jgi:hypothetical protein